MSEKEITISLNGELLFPIVLNELDDLEKIRKQLIEENIQDISYLLEKEEKLHINMKKNGF
jgi:hypothetical protein